MSDHLPDRSWLSPLLNEIAEVAGERAAIILAREKACQRIYIPKTLPGDHWLIKLVGDEAAYKIAKRFAGHLDIAPALGGQKRRRRMAIAEMTENGWSIRKISKSIGISRSTVTDTRRKIAKPAKSPKQRDLFDKE
jgi:DNA-binding NarL/FixJ family response regulator